MTESGDSNILSYDDWQELLAAFLRVQFPGVQDPKLRQWQLNYVQRPFVDQVNLVMQLPPGAGKTLIAQWVMLESLILFPKKRVLFAVPLRVLAVQLSRDVQRVLDMFNDFLKRKGFVLPSNGQGGSDGFFVGLAEGPGARVDFNRNRVVVATYEHASGELRKDPRAMTPEIHIGLVIVDEVHNIAKQDRGMVIDDIFFFAEARQEYSRSTGTYSYSALNTATGEWEVKEEEVKFPVVLGMSGTLEDWVSKRLKFAFPALFRKILTPEEILGEEAPAAPKAGAKRLFLPKKKFNPPATAHMALEITRSLLKERVNNTPNPRRLVVFMATVAEAEMAFVHVYSDPQVREYLEILAKRTENRMLPHPSGRLVSQTVPAYVHPKVSLVNTHEQLADRWKEWKDSPLWGVTRVKDSRARTPEEQTSEIVDKLFAGGVYIHHAQVEAPKLNETQETWSDVIQRQLADYDFSAVFSTSTISVGVNLNSTQIGILGPNTMWTVDQAEQMIGRVGRVDRDAPRSFVAIVDSALYHAPPAVSITAPDTWFVPRLTSVLTFSQRWAGRLADKLNLRRGLIEPVKSVENILDAFRAGEDLAVSEEDLQALANTSESVIKPFRNLDVRGFFKPWSSASLYLPDTPGNGVLPLAVAWGVVNPDGTVPIASELALELTKQDLKSLPMTMYFLTNEFTKESGESWRMVLFWAILNQRLPPKWDAKLKPKNGQPPLHAWTTHPGLFANKEQKDHAKRMVALFGEAHEGYPGQPDIPGKGNADLVLEFANAVAWGAGAYNFAWIAGKPAKLYEFLIQLRKFLKTINEDLTALVRLSTGLNLYTNSIVGAFERAFKFLDEAVFALSVQVRGQHLSEKTVLPALGYLVDAKSKFPEEITSEFLATIVEFYTTTKATSEDLQVHNTPNEKSLFLRGLNALNKKKPQ